jgi:hypothetical protein
VPCGPREETPSPGLIGSCAPANLGVLAPMPGALNWREQPMRTISSIRTAALVVALLVTACIQRVEPRPLPSQDQTTMKAFRPDVMLLVIAVQGRFDEAVSGQRSNRLPEAGIALLLEAVHASAELAGRQS